jgi:hypothetical protein
MSKTGKIILGILITAAVVLTLCLVFKKQLAALIAKLKGAGANDTIMAPFAKADAGEYVPPTNNSGSSSTDGALPQPNYKSANGNRLLKKGTTGNEVVILQTKLNNTLTTDKLIPDGVFGELTKQALLKQCGRISITLNIAKTLF